MPRTLRLRVGANLVGWGRLIKSWATDLDYVHQPLTAQPPRANWVNNTMGQPPGGTGMPQVAIATNPSPAWALPASSPDVEVPGKKANGATLARKLPLAVAMEADTFYAMMEAAGVPATEKPEKATHVIVVQGDEETMVIRLPPKVALQASEDDLICSGELYPLQPFYARLYSGTGPGLPSMLPPGASAAAQAGAREAVMELHANRIGEYTLNNCN